MERILSFVFVATSLTSIASAKHGIATFYSDYVPSACFGSKDEGVMIAAANPDLYNNGAACGTKYKVRCTGPTNKGVHHPCHHAEVEVTIVDLCPECASNQLDLSQDVFSKIANPDAGKIKIKYDRV